MTFRKDGVSTVRCFATISPPIAGKTAANAVNDLGGIGENFSTSPAPTNQRWLLIGSHTSTVRAPNPSGSITEQKDATK